MAQPVLECRRPDGLSGDDTGRSLGRASINALPFREIWAVDFEFGAKPGENPEPVCLVALELRSGRRVRLWQDEFGPIPPYPTGPDTLFVAYYASAEIGCHLALGWPVPARILDLFTEFRNAANGLSTPSGFGLIGALIYHGLDAIGTDEKEQMRELALRGGPWTPEERAALLPRQYIAVGTWQRPLEWSEPGSRSTRQPWSA